MTLLTARLRSLLPALLLLSLPACAEPDNSTTDTTPFEGRVLEAGTQKPIPGAIVLGRWSEVRSVWPADSQDVCVHVETTTSDAEGRFKLPRYRGRNPTFFDSYMAGYEEAGYNLTEAYVRHESWLQRSTKARGERIGDLSRVSSATRCGGAGKSKKNLLPLAKALYEEAQSLAVTSVEQDTVLNLLFALEIVELGYETAERRDIERRRKQR